MREDAMTLQQHWNAGRAVLNGWLSVPAGFATELMARQGWDSLTVDMQHGLVDYSGLVPMLTAMASAAVVPMVRVPWFDPGIVMKSIDAGALGVICPMINSRAEAEAFVSCLRYAPRGRRSYGPIRAALVHGADYARRADDMVTGFAMIETRAALEAIDEIVSIPELDAVYIGPNDLALSLGEAPRFDPENSPVYDAILHILARAKHHGKRAAVHTGSPAYARKMVAAGFDLVTVGSDAAFIAQGAAAAVQAFRGG
ncbi:HpcH/HpaI aldolase/citrate lyase family protein [Acidiphilium sp. C61]|uniref:HpcH/HpaI aldolase family protein n=1 Tax=Acidiphilium sp. C61 TaxID=1671485 RepID=UPI00353048BB